MRVLEPWLHPIEAILFDMDGVLCDSEPFICEAAREMFRRRFGVEVSPEEFRPFVGAGEDRYLGGVAERRGLPLRLPEDKQLTYEIYLQVIRGRLQALPGAREFVQTARELGWRLAVATSADRIKLEGNLAEIGLPPALFDARVTGSDVPRKKPHPDIFLIAALAVGTPIERCLVVEDAPNGLQAGRAAGAYCLGLTSTFDEPTLRQAGAHMVAANLADALPWLNSFRRP